MDAEGIFGSQNKRGKPVTIEITRPAHVGAWTLSARMEQMIILPLIGLSCSLIPFAGFNLGAGNGERIRQAVRISVLACHGILLPVGVILWSFAPGGISVIPFPFW